MKNLLIVYKNELLQNKKLIISFGFIIIFLTISQLSAFPIVADIANKNIDFIPSELLELRGVESLTEFNDYNVYFRSTYQIMLIPISILAILTGGSLIFKDEKQNLIEYKMMMPVSRNIYFLSKFLVGITTMIIVLGLVYISGIVTSYFVTDSFNLNVYNQIFSYGLIPVMFYFTMSFLIAGSSSKINPAAIGSGIILIGYVIGYTANIIGSDYKWIKNVVPLELFVNGTPSNALIMIYLGISVMFFGSGLVLYKNRDLSA